MLEKINDDFFSWRNDLVDGSDHNDAMGFFFVVDDQWIFPPVGIARTSDLGDFTTRAVLGGFTAEPGREEQHNKKQRRIDWWCVGNNLMVPAFASCGSGMFIPSMLTLASSEMWVFAGRTNDGFSCELLKIEKIDIYWLFIVGKIESGLFFFSSTVLLLKYCSGHRDAR